MRSAFGYLVILLLLGIYVLSAFSLTTLNLADKRGSSYAFWGMNGDKYGDLFKVSNLPQYKIPAIWQTKIPLNKCPFKPQINMYAICDSYIWNFIADKKYYCGTKSFGYAAINTKGRLNIPPVKGQDNVLLLELSEVNIRSFLTDTQYVNNLFDFHPKSESIDEPKSFAERWYRFKNKIRAIEGYVFNQGEGYNMEINVWNSNIFAPLRELKAYLNYKLFNRVDGEAVVSPDKKQLLYKVSVSNGNTSSFSEVSDTEVNTLVQRLNEINKNAHKVGFSEVYLALMPSAVSILYPNYGGLKYNNLVNRIQHHPNLKINVVDIYPTFKHAKVPVYFRSDVHWNKNGAYLWLNKFNKMLADHISRCDSLKALN